MHKLLLCTLNRLYLGFSHPYSVLFIVLTILFWFVVGGFMHYDETWYKVGHVFEIVVALLMLFLIENTQQADMRALQEKLDEIIKKLPETDNKKVKLEEKYKGHSLK